ncbi:unnamed protein product [Rotaria sp. Silwood1]|nr:unnamed protein product [Rotaria sp. Silwood1]
MVNINTIQSGAVFAWFMLLMIIRRIVLLIIVSIVEYNRSFPPSFRVREDKILRKVRIESSITRPIHIEVTKHVRVNKIIGNNLENDVHFIILLFATVIFSDSINDKCTKTIIYGVIYLFFRIFYAIAYIIALRPWRTLVFHTEDKALAYIESVVEEKILLIVDYLSDNLLNVIEALKQVDGLFLYTSVSPDKLPSCITAICSNEQQLFDEIKNIRQQISKQMTVFSIYNQTKTEKIDIHHEVGTFLFFEIFKTALKKLPKKSESKNLMVSKYRNYYAGNRKVLEEILDFEHNYKTHEALQWYVNRSFIYRLINKALHTENINSLCYFHFYIKDLSKQIEKEFRKFKKQNSQSIIQLYSSSKITKEEIKKYQRNIGNSIFTHGYLSTTRQRHLAYDFAIKQHIQSDEEKVLFQYTVDLDHVQSIIFADISQYNKLPDENEIIFDLGAVFKIESCTFNTKENLWLMNVHATDKVFEVTSEYLEYQTSKMAESNIVLTLGHLIIEMGDYDRAEKYFTTILNSSIPNDEEISCIYYHMGRIYRLKGEYERALEFLQQAFDTHSKARPSRWASAAKAMNAMGIVYMEQNNVQQAIDSFESTLKLYTKTIHECHPDIAGTLINLANIYCGLEEYKKALSCFQRAQYIYESSLPPNHPNRAILLNNLGNFYLRQNQLDLALNAYEQALNINEKTLPVNHPEIVRNRNNLSRVQIMICEQNKPDFQLEKAPDYSQVIICSSVEPNITNLFSSDTSEKHQNSDSKVEMIEMKNY